VSEGEAPQSGALRSDEDRFQSSLRRYKPFDRDIEPAVMDYDGPHALVFPCRRILRGWIKAERRPHPLATMGQTFEHRLSDSF
jgi:hypothetical protein